MSSYIRGNRVVHAVLYRFRKKDKLNKDLESPEIDPSVQETVENEGDIGKQSTNDEIFSIEDKEDEIMKNNGDVDTRKKSSKDKIFSIEDKEVEIMKNDRDKLIGEQSMKDESLSVKSTHASALDQSVVDNNIDKDDLGILEDSPDAIQMDELPAVVGEAIEGNVESDGVAIEKELEKILPADRSSERIKDASSPHDSHINETVNDAQSANNIKDTTLSAHSEITSGGSGGDDSVVDLNIDTQELIAVVISQDKKQTVSRQSYNVKDDDDNVVETSFTEVGTVSGGSVMLWPSSTSSDGGQGSDNGKKSLPEPSVHNENVVVEDKTKKEEVAVTSLPKMDKTLLCDTEPTTFWNKVKFYPVFAFANLFCIGIQFVINGLGGSGPDGTIFLNKTGDLSDKYFTTITPAGWTFSIWGFIYTWQAAWVVFTLVNICRKAPDGKAAHKDPPYIPNTIFIIQIIIAALNISWLISFDRQEIELAAAILIAYTLLQYLLLAVSVRALDKCSPTLVQQERTMDIWLTRGLLHNGIGIQLAWVNIATLLNVQMVLIYSGSELLCADTAGTVALVILSLHVVGLPIIDMVFLDVYTRYLFTPYMVVIMALAGSISKNWDAAKTNSIFSAIIISYASVLFCFKIGLTLYRHFKQPRYTTKCRCKKAIESTIE